MVIGSITTEQVLQAVDLAINMNKFEDFGEIVPNYADQNVSAKVVKLIQSYTGIVNKVVWRKY
jgi:UDP-N-acetyl-L-fucosamine synthase